VQSERLKQAFTRLILLVFLTALSACMSPDNPAVPPDLLDEVSVGRLEGLRSWGDGRSELPEERMSEQAQLVRQTQLETGREFNVLALSGGGQSGAYGAGLLNGWTQNGSRPVFDVVTGISTGAIIAPFAFLGSKYDPVLKTIYTTTTSADIGRMQVLAGLVRGTGLMQPVGFEKLLADYVTPELMEEIAIEARKGRFLLIGTTNLEAERSMIWNIGVLANSNYPRKLELMRDIIQASASIPGVFPPVRITVNHGDQQFDELHVDGGVTEQVFLYPPSVSIKDFEKALGYELDKRVYVVRNAKLDSTYEELKSNTVKIVERSLNTLIKMQGRSDVKQIENIAKRDGFQFRLSAIPESFDVASKEFFDPNYMRPLFALGFENGADQSSWMRTAP